MIRSTMDDTSSTPIAASANIRYMMAFTYLILSVIGIIPNIILAITLYKLGSMPKQNVFVLLAKQILISDFCQLSSQLFVAFPLALYGRNIYEGSAAIWIYNVVNFLDTVGYNGVLDFTFIMAMNRVTVFLLPKVHQAFFGGRAAMWTVVFVWSFLFMQIIVANVMRCHKQFTYEEFYFYFQCANRDALHVEIWLESMRYQSFTFPVIMFFTYVVIFIFIKTRLSTHSDGTTKHRKYEINLLLQRTRWSLDNGNGRHSSSSTTQGLSRLIIVSPPPADESTISTAGCGADITRRASGRIASTLRACTV